MKSQKILKQSQKTLGAAVASSILTAALMAVPTVASAASTDRCADIVKGGKNTCASKQLGISCQGIYLLCNLVLYLLLRSDILKTYYKYSQDAE